MTRPAMAAADGAARAVCTPPAALSAPPAPAMPSGALSRRRLLAPLVFNPLLGVGAGLGLGLGAAGAAHAATLPAPASLAAELAAALARRQPLVVMASLDGCPYCRIVRDRFLAPLRAETGLPVVQLDSGSAQAVRDFSGAASTHAALLRAWRVEVWPTVLFFGAGGAEAAERLVGAAIPDFYGAYLEERLQAARRRIARG